MAKNKIIQFGGLAVPLSDQILEKFDYVHVEGNYDLYSDEEKLKLFQDGVFNRRANRNLYIFGRDAVLLQNFPGLLEQFPPFQLFYDEGAEIDPSQKKILDIKKAEPFDPEAESQEALYAKINDLSIEQIGYNIEMDFIRVNPSFKGDVTRMGNVFMELDGDFGDDYKQLLSWKMHPYGIEAHGRVNFIPEWRIDSEGVEIEFRIFYIDFNTGQTTKIITGKPEDFASEDIILVNESDTGQHIATSLYAKGKGKFRVGNVHFRNAFSDKSALMKGGQRFQDKDRLNQEIFHLFNPGDMKPPLAVYFSGYRPAEGFEGRGMMNRMGCPYLLISDPRLEGGDFYMGSESLEKELVDVIQEHLDFLGFERRDLILSGISMGTFAALYYAADLQPSSVIVGKPLVNVGDIAMNERIDRPELWGTSLDMVMDHTGEATVAGAKRLNQRFWDKFDKGDFNRTTFAAAYMIHDDYDQKAFPMIEKSLAKNNPQSRVLQKGFIGRHNDNTPGVTEWFRKQYRNILWEEYGRRVRF
ncbi:accessory Sec system protein Asp2 [Lactococcus termiticola]|uniref:Accessory Sec system protein Asp2 n=1 Tax=Lactococcus termiticola TaxID=2169526 RepID=A0A2R5HET6_9LACT|nr:accessory Sec system protein Asp2 [Lactococcus termiticola]GBG96356.1 accessory Sec system protein Asp2 [Lactococcus termiticola]